MHESVCVVLVSLRESSVSLEVLEEAVVLPSCGVTAKPTGEFWSPKVPSHELPRENTGEDCL